MYCGHPVMELISHPLLGYPFHFLIATRCCSPNKEVEKQAMEPAMVSGILVCLFLNLFYIHKVYCRRGGAQGTSAPLEDFLKVMGYISSKDIIRIRRFFCSPWNPSNLKFRVHKYILLSLSFTGPHSQCLIKVRISKS